MKTCTYISYMYSGQSKFPPSFNISQTVHPINYIFGSRLGFSGSADGGANGAIAGSLRLRRCRAFSARNTLRHPGFLVLARKVR